MKQGTNMKKNILILWTAVAVTAAAFLRTAMAGPVPPAPGASIQNSGNPQPNAQFNVSSGSIRGPLYVGSILPVSGGAPISLTASSVPAAGVQAGSLGASVIASSVAAGAVGTVQIAAGAVTTAKLGDASVTNAKVNPETFTNITLPAANVASGSLGASVIASSVAARKVGDAQLTVTGVSAATYGSATAAPVAIVDAQGRITSASNVTITPAAASITAGTLGATVIASSVGATGIAPATYGSATAAPVCAFALDGRATTCTNTTVTPAAGSITAGTLGATVVASSVAATGTSTGTYGSATQSAQVVVGVDGRLSSVSNVTITGVPAASVPASGVQAGTLGATVIASSVAASGVTPTSYGSATAAPAITVGGDGRITSATTNTITPAAGSITAGTLGTSVIASSVGAAAVGTEQIAASAVTNAKMAAATYANVTIPAANVAAGTLGSSVIASSVAATGIAAGSSGSATQAPAITVGVDGRITALSANTITPAATSITAGTLGATVIASSVGASGVVPGTFGSATQTGVIVVTADGRITSASNATVTPAAASIQAGSLGASVIASSVAAASVGPEQVQSGATYTVGRLRATSELTTGDVLTVVGTSTFQGDSYHAGKVGVSTNAPQLPLDVQGGAAFGTGLTRSTFTNAGALTLAKNASLTLSGPTGNFVSGSSVTAGYFAGDGGGITNISGALTGGLAGAGAYWTGATTLGNGAFTQGTSSTTWDAAHQNVMLSSLTTRGLATFNTSGSTQVVAQGFSSYDGANAGSGQVQVGGTATAAGRIAYTNAGAMHVDNTYNGGAAATIDFNHNTSAASVTSLTLSPTAATLGATVPLTVLSSPTFRGLATFDTAGSTQAVFQGFSPVGGALAANGSVRIGSNGRIYYDNTGNGDLYIENTTAGAASAMFLKTTGGKTMMKLYDRAGEGGVQVLPNGGAASIPFAVGSSFTYTSDGVMTNGVARSTAAVFQGFSKFGGLSSINGLVSIGNATTLGGFLDYNNSDDTFTIGHNYDNNNAKIAFRMRTAGTYVTPLVMTGAGQTTFSSSVTFTNGSTFNAGGQSGSTVYGSSASALGTAATAIGDRADASINATALGNGAIAGSGTTSIGTLAKSTGPTAVALGYSANAAGDSNISIGYAARTDNSNAIAIGAVTSADGYGTAVGPNATSTGTFGIAIGRATASRGAYASAVGTQSDATGAGSAVLGYAGYAAGTYGLAVGATAASTGAYSVALGAGALAKGDYDIAVGLNAFAGATDSIAIGRSAQARHAQAIAIGVNSATTAPYDIVLGNTNHNVKIPGTLGATTIVATSTGLIVSGNSSIGAPNANSGVLQVGYGAGYNGLIDYDHASRTLRIVGNALDGAHLDLMTTNGSGVRTSAINMASAGTVSIIGSTLTVTQAGVVSAPSQPRGLVDGFTNTTAVGGVVTKIFWSTDRSSVGGLWGGASSSGTFTAPADGLYHITCAITFTASTPALARVRVVAAGLTKDSEAITNPTTSVTNTMTWERQMSATNTADCSAYSPSTQTLDGSANSHMEVVKIL